MDNTVKTMILNCDDLKDESLFDLYYQLMPAHRRQKISAFRFYKDKRLSLGAGILLEGALRDYGTENIRFEKNGKPYIPDCPVHFNLSHSGSIAMIALSNHSVGCDVEKIKPVNFEIARRFFFGCEYEFLLKEKDDEKRQRLFFRLWTLKESFMKATGMGMSLGLDKFCIDISGENPSVYHALNDKHYSLTEYDISLPYCFSVCSEGKTKFSEKPEIADISKEGLIPELHQEKSPE